MGNIALVDDSEVRRQKRGGLTWADAALDTPHGRIRSGWWLADDKVTIEVAVPSGAKAEVRLPSGASHHVGVGRHRFCEPRTNS